MHLVRVLFKILCCSIFSNSRIVNSFKHRWRQVSLIARRSSSSSVCSRAQCDGLSNPVSEVLSLGRSCFGYHFFILMVLRLIPELPGVMEVFSGFISSRLILRREKCESFLIIVFCLDTTWSDCCHGRKIRRGRRNTKQKSS